VRQMKGLRTAAATLLVLVVVSLAPAAAAAGRGRAAEFDGSLATQLQSIIDAAPELIGANMSRAVLDWLEAQPARAA
jgi:hypothetical protein